MTYAGYTFNSKARCTLRKPVLLFSFLSPVMPTRHPPSFSKMVYMQGASADYAANPHRAGDIEMFHVMLPPDTYFPVCHCSCGPDRLHHFLLSADSAWWFSPGPRLWPAWCCTSYCSGNSGGLHLLSPGVALSNHGWWWELGLKKENRTWSPLCLFSLPVT
jgi:hypothetical protein